MHNRKNFPFYLILDFPLSYVFRWYLHIKGACFCVLARNDDYFCKYDQTRNHYNQNPYLVFSLFAVHLFWPYATIHCFHVICNIYICINKENLETYKTRSFWTVFIAYIVLLGRVIVALVSRYHNNKIFIDFQECIMYKLVPTCVKEKWDT